MGFSGRSGCSTRHVGRRGWPLRVLAGVAWVACLFAGRPAVSSEGLSPSESRLGINLAGPADWNTELPFVDVFRLSRPWISQRKGQPWGKGPTLDLDAHGWVKRLEPDCWAETLLCTIDRGHWMHDNKKIADKYHVKLVAYEAGQHLVGVAGGENNQRLTELFMAANRHPRMGRLYTQYLDAWRDAGGDLCAVFSSVGRFSKWGSWGLLEFYDDDTPKFRAVMQWNEANPRTRR